MEVVKIKGSAINHSRANYIEQYGEDFWQELVEQACQRTGYERVNNFLDPAFYPLDLYMEIEKVFAEKMGQKNKDYCLTFKGGMDNAERAFTTTYKVFMKFINRKRLVKAANRMMRWYYNDDNGKLITDIDRRERKITFNYQRPKIKHPYDYALLGYFTKALMLAGFNIKKAIHGNLVWQNGRTKLQNKKLTPSSAEGDDDTVFIFKF